jgi:hypothetical protein
MKRRDHGYIINKQDYNVRLTVDHILWDCKEPEVERQKSNIQNLGQEKRRNETTYRIRKKIGFYQDNMKEQNNSILS